MPVGGRLRVRAARHALVLALALLAMGALAINHRSNAAWLMVSVAAAAAAASLAHGYRNLSRLSAALLPVAPVPAGQPVVLAVRLRNASRQDAHGLLVLGPGGAEAAIPLVPADGEAEVAITLPGQTRGVRPPSELAVESAYPLGLARWRRAVAPAGELVVHPVPRGRTLAAGPDTGHGQVADGTVAGDSDFRGHRRLHPGDSPRRIDWKASERGEHLLVKDWSGSGGDLRLLTWDDAVGADEERLSQLALWVLEADAAGVPYGLALPGAVLAPGTGVGHRHACLRALAAHPVAGS